MIEQDESILLGIYQGFFNLMTLACLIRIVISDPGYVISNEEYSLEALRKANLELYLKNQLIISDDEKSMIEIEEEVDEQFRAD